MKGYLLKEQQVHFGEDCFIQVDSPENGYSVFFEDDGDTGYFYAAERSGSDANLQILDMLHIYDVTGIEERKRDAVLSVLWSYDWLSCGLILDNVCHALFDFKNQLGLNLNEFPPPNSLWSKPERKLTNEILAKIFK